MTGSPPIYHPGNAERDAADARRARGVAQALDCAADRLCVVESEKTELIAALRTLSGCGHNALLAHIGRLLR
jgi:hypothetical protein